jgi:hypothetical protein
LIATKNAIILYQDRLGTDIGKALEKKKRFCRRNWEDIQVRLPSLDDSMLVPSLSRQIKSSIYLGAKQTQNTVAIFFLQCDWGVLSAIIGHWGEFSEELAAWAGPGHWHDPGKKAVSCPTF